mmetsp:Transcript_15577/g.37100  ORF Transcript_15577/g.37100 Transcript_15577/m.37100 type:complete len:245 (-) Transcript_15577:1441-2175(-)
MACSTSPSSRPSSRRHTWKSSSLASSSRSTRSSTPRSLRRRRCSRCPTPPTWLRRWARPSWWTALTCTVGWGGLPQTRMRCGRLVSLWSRCTSTRRACRAGVGSSRWSTQSGRTTSMPSTSPRLRAATGCRMTSTIPPTMPRGPSRQLTPSSPSPTRARPPTTTLRQDSWPRSRRAVSSNSLTCTDRSPPLSPPSTATTALPARPGARETDPSTPAASANSLLVIWPETEVPRLVRMSTGYFLG